MIDNTIQSAFIHSHRRCNAFSRDLRFWVQAHALIQVLVFRAQPNTTSYWLCALSSQASCFLSAQPTSHRWYCCKKHCARTLTPTIDCTDTGLELEEVTLVSVCVRSQESELKRERERNLYCQCQQTMGSTSSCTVLLNKKLYCVYIRVCIHVIVCPRETERESTSKRDLYCLFF